MPAGRWWKGDHFFQTKEFFSAIVLCTNWCTTICIACPILCEIECIEFVCNELVLVLVQIDLIQFEFSNCISVKLQIDSKDPMAYRDDAFVCDIFVQLKNELLPHDFKSEFTSLERRWQMDKEIITSQSLMDDASTYYTCSPRSKSLSLNIE